MKGLFIPEISSEMFRNGCLESIETLMAEGEIYDIDYSLEQEPCEDAISRKDIYFKLTNGASPNETIEQFIDRLVKELDALPPVTPQPKTGKWIEERNDYGEITNWHCSNCYDDCGFITTCAWRYCPSCGSKMEVEE